MIVIRTADEWLQQPEWKGLLVMDPDGWDRRNFKASWAEKITAQEFEKRVCMSTCMWPKGRFAAQILKAEA